MSRSAFGCILKAWKSPPGEIGRYLTHRLGEVLKSRESGRPTAEFLQGHAGLKQSDANFYLGVLERVTKEVGKAGQ